MSKTEKGLGASQEAPAIPQNNVIVSHLAIERCQNYMAHMHAIMHMCEPRDLGLEPFVAENVKDLMRRIDSELDRTQQVLKLAETDYHQ